MGVRCMSERLFPVAVVLTPILGIVLSDEGCGELREMLAFMMPERQSAFKRRGPHVQHLDDWVTCGYELLRQYPELAQVEPPPLPNGGLDAWLAQQIIALGRTHFPVRPMQMA